MTPVGGRRRAPRLVRLATVAFVALCGLWSVLTPLAEAPDEPAHYGLVLHLADTGRYPTHDGLHHTDGMFQICVDYAYSALWCRTGNERARGVRVRDHPADEAPPKDERPFWDDPDFQRPVRHRLNQMPQHPPLYYEAMAGALRIERNLVPGEMSADTELAYLRLLNALLLAPLPWLAWWLARRLGADDTVGTLAALVPLGIPQLTHIGATLNNDNLFVLLTSVLLALLAGVLRGDRSLRTALLVGLVTGLALLTKGFGIVLPPIVLLAYAVASLRPAASWRRRVASVAGPCLLALAVGGVVCGWWYASNLADTGKLMPSIEDTRLNPANALPGVRPTFDGFLHSTVSRVVMGFWGAFGWRRVELPMALSAVLTAVSMGLATEAFRGDARRSPAIPRRALLVLLAPVVALGVFVVVRAAVIYSDTGRLAFQQGRYLFGGLVGAATVVALGARHLLRDRAVPLVAGTVVAVQAVGIAWCLEGWWDLTEVGPIDALRAVVAWSGWPDPIAVALLVPAPLLLALLLADVRNLSRASPDDRPSQPPDDDDRQHGHDTTPRPAVAVPVSG